MNYPIIYLSKYMVDKCTLSELKALLHGYIDNNTDVSLNVYVTYINIK